MGKKYEGGQFVHLAERISIDIDLGDLFCCVDLYDREDVTFFTEWFKPTEKEKIKYNHEDYYAWLSIKKAKKEEENEGRVLFLCMAEAIFETEGYDLTNVRK